MAPSGPALGGPLLDFVTVLAGSCQDVSRWQDGDIRSASRKIEEQIREALKAPQSLSLLLDCCPDLEPSRVLPSAARSVQALRQVDRLGKLLQQLIPLRDQKLKQAAPKAQSTGSEAARTEQFQAAVSAETSAADCPTARTASTSSAGASALSAPQPVPQPASTVAVSAGDGTPTGHREPSSSSSGATAPGQSMLPLAAPAPAKVSAAGAASQQAEADAPPRRPVGSRSGSLAIWLQLVFFCFVFCCCFCCYLLLFC
ncbi:unnamed protein product [Polarella glacialis]|uniref:Uncharacterized protein n=1 Tax=Polarella glacialis TaxID=89957 RepID=A0A813DPK7_POLGL|nr:unnamed protein product [Polarella glacialis]